MRAWTLALLLAGLAGPAWAEGSPLGEWITDGDKARVLIAPCAGQPGQLCGTITWSYRPPDAGPGPLHDINNTDPSLRARPIVGLPLLQGFSQDGPKAWSGGTIYDPEGGMTHKSKLKLTGPDTLQVDGCILFFCESQVWRRYRG